MIDLKVQGTGRFERAGNYVRVRRIGNHVYVAGTTAIEASGQLHAPGNTYEQTRFILNRAASVLAKVDAGLRHVVLTRAYLADISTAGEFIRAHGESFAGILPVCTATQTVLTRPGMMVEMELEAIVRELPDD